MKRKFTLLKLLFCLFISIGLKAQNTTSPQWEWMKGDNQINTQSEYGTKGTANQGNKPGARTGSVTWSDASGNLWLFGGSFGGYFFNDLWKYNTTTNEWTWINGANTKDEAGNYGTKNIASPTNTPSARSGSVSWTDALGSLWLFGGYAGYDGAVMRIFNDLWKYNPSTNQWTWMNGDNTKTGNYGVYGIKGTAGATNKPGSRFLSNAWTDGNGNFWLYGGHGLAASGGTNNKNTLSDLWKYEPLTNQWTWISGANTIEELPNYGTLGIATLTNAPGARSGATTWVDAAGNLWLFGGLSTFKDGAVSLSFNDLWKYTPTTNRWTWVKGANTNGQATTYGVKGIANATNTPSARSYSVAWTDNIGNFWLFGGFQLTAVGSNAVNDLWHYNLNTNQWTWISGSNTTNQSGTYGDAGVPNQANVPGGRYSGVSWRDALGNFWLFGGEGMAKNTRGYLNDLWKFADTTVSPLTFVSLNAYRQNTDIGVEWGVKNESGVKQYEVEKSTDGLLFSKTAVLNATGDTTTSSINYKWMDVNLLTGNFYYRIKSVGLNGRSVYSPVAKIVMGDSYPHYKVYPNPIIGGNVQLQFYDQPKGVYSIQIVNTLGQVMLTSQINHAAESNTEPLFIGKKFNRGSYTLVIINPSNIKQSIKISY